MLELVGQIYPGNLEETHVSEALIVQGGLEIISHAGVDHISRCKEGVRIVACGSIIKRLDYVLLAWAKIPLSVLSIKLR